jgi:predicted nucleotidyltransferase
VLALIKRAASLDRPVLREKDLADLLLIMACYEAETDRRFGDDVLAAGVEYDEAGAFLLGRDLQRICRAPVETGAVEKFLQRVTDPGFDVPARSFGRLSDEEAGADAHRRRCAALARGFRGASVDI